MFLSYDPKVKQRIIKIDRIDEIILRITRDNIDFQITNSACDTIDRIKNEKKSEIIFYRRPQFDESLITKKLYNYQIEAILWRLSRNRYLDSLDSGLGKTIVNLSVFYQIYKDGKVDSALIIVPSGLSYHWKKEILDSTNLFKDDDIVIVDNNNKIIPFTTYQDKKIVIMSNHYRILADCILSYRNNKRKIKDYKKIQWKKQKLNLREVWNKKDIFLLIDESHNFKDIKSVRSKALNSIKFNFNYIALLSATPWINNIEHAYNQINLIDESIINMNDTAFKYTIADKIGNNYSKDAIVSYNEDNVNKFLKSIKHVFYKKLKEDIPEMMAKKIVKPIYLEIHPLQREIYQKVVENEIYKLQQEYNKITWKLILNKLSLLCYALDNPFLITDIVTPEITNLLDKWSLKKDPKFNALKSLLENYIDSMNEKVVVFGVHPRTLDMLYMEFKKYKPLIIHGSLKGIKDKEIDRQQKEDLFNNSDENKLIILSALTSSQGINLQKKCRRNIVYESPDAEKFRQLQDRTHRINSKNDTINEILTIDKTLDVYRVQRNLNRINFNDKLGKEISQKDLSNLLRGII